MIFVKNNHLIDDTLRSITAALAFTDFGRVATLVLNEI
jgi:hypothetical protein